MMFSWQKVRTALAAALVIGVQGIPGLALDLTNDFELAEGPAAPEPDEEEPSAPEAASDAGWREPWTPEPYRAEPRPEPVRPDPPRPAAPTPPPPEPDLTLGYRRPVYPDVPLPTLTAAQREYLGL